MPLQLTGTHTRTVSSSTPLSTYGFRVSVTNPDGIAGEWSQDVRVTVRVAKVHVPLQPPCQNMGFAGAGQPPPNLPAPPLQAIDFIARGAALAPTPSGARVLAAIAVTMTP